MYLWIYIHIYLSYMYIYIYVYVHVCIYMYTCLYEHIHIHMRIYIYIYIYIYTKTAAKEAVLLPVKSSSDNDPGFRHGFGAEASLPLIQGAPAVSHNTTKLNWMVFNLCECHIRSDAVTALFWIFFIYFLFFAGESPILVKNVEVAFEIKPRHPISRGNMSVDQSVLVHCSRRSSYFSNFRWCAQSMLVSKGVVNSAMITFFELTDQITRSGRWRVDVISVGKASCRSTSAITRQSVQPSSNVGLCLLFLCGVFETFPSLTNCIFVFIHEIYECKYIYIYKCIYIYIYIYMYIHL